MPANYAHRVFGREVLSALSPSLSPRIRAHPLLFQMGLHGPDLLFYYIPLWKTPLGQLGYSLHRHTGREVIFAMLEAVKTLPEEQQEAGEVYTLGFICHYLLDSACHPYVEQLVKSGKAPHCTIEGEFDLWLMEKEGNEPLATDPVSHVAGMSDEDFAVIAAIFAQLSKIDSPDLPLKSRPRQVAFAHKTMQLLCHIFASKSALVRGFARIGLFVTGNYENRRGMIAHNTADPAFDGCSGQLYVLLTAAAAEAPAILEGASRGYMGERFDHSFEG